MNVGCPTCGTEVQADWDWCHACGFDPDGKRQSTYGGGVPPGQRFAGPPQVPVGLGPAYGAYQPGWGPSQRPPASTRKIVGIVVAVVLLAVCLPVVAIVGVTFLITLYFQLAAVMSALRLDTEDPFVGWEV